MKYLFIMSTKAANGKNLPNIQSIEEAMVGKDYKLHYTNYKGEPEDLARQYAEKYGEEICIYACGGDGTINEVAKGLVGTEAYMGVIPSGTGNDFCRTIYEGKSSDEIIRDLKNAKKTKLDIIKLNEHYSLNIGAFGFDCLATYKVVNNCGNIKKYGELSYLIAVYQSLMEKREYKIDYEFNLANGSIAYGKGDFLLGNMANCKYYGGGFMPAPNASPTDGEIDIMLVDTISVQNIIRLLFKYRSGQHLNLEQVHTFKAKSGTITSHEGPIIANYDGEVFEFEELKFELLEKKINFMI